MAAGTGLAAMTPFGIFQVATAAAAIPAFCKKCLRVSFIFNLSFILRLFCLLFTYNFLAVSLAL